MAFPRVFWLFFALALTACEPDAPPADSAPSAAVEAALVPVGQALAQGQHVVVTFLPEDAAARRADDPSDEGYADWAYYLNDFLSSSNVVQFTFPLDQAPALFGALRPDSLSTLFIRADSAALFHQAPIFEEYVYAYASAFFVDQAGQLTLSGLLGLPPGDLEEPDTLASALGFEPTAFPSLK